MFKLEDLPYSYDALAPYMSTETLEYHHDKHHLAYITFVNNFIKENQSFEGKSLEEIIKISCKDPSLYKLWQNAGQILNHNEFWKSMKKNENAKIPGVLEAQINKDFGGIDKFKEHFISSGLTLFGSGWVWLTFIDGKLSFAQYQNGDNPVSGDHPLILGCDTWEHSFYLDYRNKKADYLNAFINHLVNWEYVEYNFTKATKH